MLSIHLIYPEYINDYIEMGVDVFLIPGTMSTYTNTQLELDDITALKRDHPDKQFFVMVNGLYEQHVLDELKAYLKDLVNTGADGIVFQDFGVLYEVRKHHYPFKMLYESKTLNTNHETLNVLSSYGIDSAMVSREIPLEEQIAINSQTRIPLMIQVHGVSYMGSSKRHLLTHYGEAAGKQLTSDTYEITADGSQYPCYIYEDQWGTTIFSKSRIYMLDLLPQLADFAYLYIETMFMDAHESLEVTSIYADCLKAVKDGRYNRSLKEYLALLKKVSSPLEKGFIDDKTIYHLEDVKWPSTRAACRKSSNSSSPSTTSPSRASAASSRCRICSASIPSTTPPSSWSSTAAPTS